MGVRERGRFGTGALVRRGCLSARGGESGRFGFVADPPREESGPFRIINYRTDLTPLSPLCPLYVLTKGIGIIDFYLNTKQGVLQ